MIAGWGFDLLKQTAGSAKEPLRGKIEFGQSPVSFPPAVIPSSYVFDL
jgi:hypothetical protein